MEISFLADHPSFVPTLVQWHHQEWSYLRPGESIADRAARLRAACGRSQIPTVFVAHDGAELLGSAMLIAHDMDTRMELSSWLAGVFVASTHRGQGIGAALVRRATEEAGLQQVPRLYLYTPTAEAFYARLGWAVCDRLRYRTTDVTLMTKEITPQTESAGSAA